MYPFTPLPPAPHPLPLPTAAAGRRWALRHAHPPARLPSQWDGVGGLGRLPPHLFPCPSVAIIPDICVCWTISQISFTIACMVCQHHVMPCWLYSLLVALNLMCLPSHYILCQHATYSQTPFLLVALLCIAYQTDHYRSRTRTLPAISRACIT